jgi:hypothetical protein
MDGDEVLHIELGTTVKVIPGPDFDSQLANYPTDRDFVKFFLELSDASVGRFPDDRATRDAISLGLNSLRTTAITARRQTTQS